MGRAKTCRSGLSAVESIQRNGSTNSAASAASSSQAAMGVTTRRERENAKGRKRENERDGRGSSPGRPFSSCRISRFRSFAFSRSLRPDRAVRAFTSVRSPLSFFIIDPPGGGTEDDQGGDQGDPKEQPGHRAGAAHPEVLKGILEQVERIKGRGKLRA